MATLTVTPNGPNKVLGKITLDTNAGTITLTTPQAGCRGVVLVCASAWKYSDASAGTYQDVAANQPLLIQLPSTLKPFENLVFYGKVASGTADLTVFTV